MTLRRFATGVELVVAAAVVVFVILLFTNDPTTPPAAPAVAAPTGTDAGGTAVDAAALYGDNCAGCHGGDGSGGIGPRLSGGRVVVAYPDPADQIVVVTDGRGGMPAFGDRLTEEEIAALVDYTRTVLAGG